MSEARRLSRDSGQRRCVSDEPDVAERIGEPALPMDAPRSLMVRHLVGRPVSSGRDRPGYERVRVGAEHLDADGRRADLGRAGEPVRCRLVQKKGAPSMSSPATLPRLQSRVAPSACWYQSTAAAVDETASMSEIRIAA